MKSDFLKVCVPPHVTAPAAKRRPVVMDGGKLLLKHTFIFTLGLVVVVTIYLNTDKQSMAAWTAQWNGIEESTEVAPLAEPRWEDPGPYYVAYPRNYKFIMDDTQTCRNTTPFLILMVPVAPSNSRMRDVIRRTWGNEKMVLGQRVETIFVTGLPRGSDAEEQQESLELENQMHHDVIQSNFLDSYHNLTIKTMVMLEWLTANCNKSAFFMKIDTDMLLHVQNLVKLLLDQSTPQQYYMTGLVWWHSPVLRNPFFKFFMPTEVIAESEYPPYPLGMAYVMSMDLPPLILRVSPEIKAIYIEDAYLGLCLRRLGISPTDPPRNDMFLVMPDHPLSSCTLSKVIAVTTTSIPQMMSYWGWCRQTVQC